MNDLDLIQIFAGDRRMIPYRPEWREFTGSVTATILLGQIIYRWDKHGRKPFYKFRVPCNHKLCKPGDSWTEELGFSIKEFDNALKKIAFKRTAKNHSEHHIFPVEYNITRDRVTYYTVITENLSKLFRGVYSASKPEEPPENPESEILVNAERGFSLNAERDFSKMPKRDLPENTQREFSKMPKRDFTILHRIPNKKTTANKETSSASQTDSSSPPLASFSGSISESEFNALISLIPAKVTHQRGSWLITKSDGYDPDYIKEKILYSNRQVKDLRKYWAYLGKSIEFNYGQGFLADLEEEQQACQRIAKEAEQKRKDEVEQKRRFDEEAIVRQKVREQFQSLSEDKQQELRDAFMENTNTFNMQQLGKLSLSDSIKCSSFLNYCTDILSLLSN